MAEETNVPPAPPSGTIVTPAALYNTEITLWRNTMAFGGMRSPTAIWQEMVRNGGLAIPFYRELEEKDTDVANALDTLRQSVLKREHRVTPADQSSLAIDIAQFIEAQLNGLPDFHQVLANLMDGPGYGFSIGEMVFDTSNGQANLLDVLDCPQELFLFGDRYQPQIGPLQFLDQPQASSGTLVPEQKFVVCTYRMRARDRMGRPLLRAIFWSSWFKRNMQRLWMRYAEKGPGTAAVRYQDGASEAEKQLAANLAQQLIEQVAVGIPEDFNIEVELLKGARPIAYEVYEHFYEVMQLDIVRRILGETLTSFGAEKGRGAQALGNVHSESLDDKSVELAKWLAGCINRQIVRPLVWWNYGPNAPMPTWSLDVDEEKDLTELANLHKTLQAMGVPFPVSFLQQTYDIPVPEGDEPIAKPTQGSATAPDAPVGPNFAEDAGREIADAQLIQFDQLARQMQQESLLLLGERTRQVAGSLSDGRK